MGSGMRDSIVSSFRLVFFVGGRTAVFIEWCNDSENQCFGTRMYSIFRGAFLDPFSTDPTVFRAFRGRDGCES